MSTKRRSSHEAIVELLDHERCRFRIHSHEPVITASDAQKLVPELTGNLFKTVVFRTTAGRTVLASLPHDERISYRDLAAVIGVNRRDLRPVAAADVSSMMGVEVGGVGPFPETPDTVVVIDSSINQFATVNCGCGSRTLTVEIDAADLIRVTGAVVTAITKHDQADTLGG